MNWRADQGRKQEKSPWQFDRSTEQGCLKWRNNRMEVMGQWEDFNTWITLIPPQMAKTSLETRLENELAASNKVIQ